MFTIWTIPFLVYPYRHYIHHVYNMNYAISCLSISPLYPSCLQNELCHFLFIHIAIISIMFTLWTIPFLVYPYRHYIHHAYIMNYAISCLSISPLHPSCLQYELCHFLFIHITIYAYKYGQITRFNFHSYFIRSYKWVSFTFNLSRCNMPNGYSNIEYCLMNPLQQYYLCHYKLFFYGRIDTCQEEVEDTKGVIRIRISKNRQHNGQKKKYKWTIYLVCMTLSENSG